MWEAKRIPHYVIATIRLLETSSDSEPDSLTMVTPDVIIEMTVVKEGDPEAGTEENAPEVRKTVAITKAVNIVITTGTVTKKNAPVSSGEVATIAVPIVMRARRRSLDGTTKGRRSTVIEVVLVRKTDIEVIPRKNINVRRSPDLDPVQDIAD